MIWLVIAMTINGLVTCLLCVVALDLRRWKSEKEKWQNKQAAFNSFAHDMVKAANDQIINNSEMVGDLIENQMRLSKIVQQMEQRERTRQWH